MVWTIVKAKVMCVRMSFTVGSVYGLRRSNSLRIFCICLVGSPSQVLNLFCSSRFVVICKGEQHRKLYNYSNSLIDQSEHYLIVSRMASESCPSKMLKVALRSVTTDLLRYARVTMSKRWKLVLHLLQNGVLDERKKLLKRPYFLGVILPCQ